MLNTAFWLIVISWLMIPFSVVLCLVCLFIDSIAVDSSVRHRGHQSPGTIMKREQDVIRYIEADKPLPDKYRILLFDEKREVELVWNGKTSEVCNIVLPFQVIEQVDEPRSGKSEDTVVYGYRNLAGWSRPPAQRWSRANFNRNSRLWHRCANAKCGQEYNLSARGMDA